LDEAIFSLSSSLADKIFPFSFSAFTGVRETIYSVATGECIQSNDEMTPHRDPLRRTALFLVSSHGSLKDKRMQCIDDRRANRSVVRSLMYVSKIRISAFSRTVRDLLQSIITEYFGLQLAVGDRDCHMSFSTPPMDKYVPVKERNTV
jgi:hypothetical protein